MYTQIRSSGWKSFASTEALPLIAAFVLAELFYKFHSFVLECGAFLLTWYFLSASYHFFLRWLPFLHRSKETSRQA